MCCYLARQNGWDTIALVDPVLLLTLISFPPSLLILSFYFSSYIGTRAGKRNSLSRQGLLTSFAGLSIGTALSLLSPIVPGPIPVLDIAIILAAVTWVALLRRYCRTGWLETLPQAFIPVVTYVVILAIASAFVLLFTARAPNMKSVAGMLETILKLSAI